MPYPMIRRRPPERPAPRSCRQHHNGSIKTPVLAGAQLVKRRRAQPVLPTNLDRWQPGLLLLDHPDDLRLGKTALSHASAPSSGQTLHYNEGAFGGQVTHEQGG